MDKFQRNEYAMSQVWQPGQVRWVYTPAPEEPNCHGSFQVWKLQQEWTNLLGEREWRWVPRIDATPAGLELPTERVPWPDD